MALTLVYYGDPILRKRAHQVEEIDDDLRDVVRGMTQWIRDNGGFGLAAPQVGRSWRLFVANLPVLRPDGYYDPSDEILVFINPKLSSPSKDTWTRGEACFSLPGIHAHVTRPMAVTIEAMDLEGNIFTLNLHDMAARIVMHENDHINGVLMIDRMPSKERRSVEIILRKIVKEHPHSR